MSRRVSPPCKTNRTHVVGPPNHDIVAVSTLKASKDFQSSNDPSSASPASTASDDFGSSDDSGSSDGFGLSDDVALPGYFGSSDGFASSDDFGSSDYFGFYHSFMPPGTIGHLSPSVVIDACQLTEDKRKLRCLCTKCKGRSTRKAWIVETHVRKWGEDVLDEYWLMEENRKVQCDCTKCKGCSTRRAWIVETHVRKWGEHVPEPNTMAHQVVLNHPAVLYRDSSIGRPPPSVLIDSGMEKEQKTQNGKSGSNFIAVTKSEYEKELQKKLQKEKRMETEQETEGKPGMHVQ